MSGGFIVVVVCFMYERAVIMSEFVKIEKLRCFIFRCTRKLKYFILVSVWKPFTVMIFSLEPIGQCDPNLAQNILDEGLSCFFI